MLISELEQRLKQNKLDNLYFFYGEEVYLLEQCLKKIKKLFGKMIEGINYIKIDNTNIETLIDNIEVPAFGYEKKLIIVRDSGLFPKGRKKRTKKKDQKENDETEEKDKSEKIAQYIENNIEQIAETTILVFIEREVQENALFKVLTKKGIACDFELQKPQELVGRIIEISKMYGVNIDRSTASYLIENCGQEMLPLINELRKQIECAGKGGTITRETIDEIACKRIEGYIFGLTDSLGVNNIKKALKELDDLLYTKEPIQKILIAQALCNYKNIIIFDETTSQLDVKTERRILLNIKKMYKDITLILISHRYLNKDVFDKEIYIKGGSVYEKIKSK